MKISTQTSFLCARFGIEEAIRKIAAAGFDAVDLTLSHFKDPAHPLNGSDYQAYARHLREVAEGCHIRFNQTHAPYASYNHSSVEEQAAMVPRLIRAIEITAILGAEIIVMHPCKFPENPFELNRLFFEQFVPYLEKFKVKAAVENMFSRDPVTREIVPAMCGTPEAFVAFMDSLDPAYFVACLDIGHAHLTGSQSGPSDMIAALGHRLMALHVSDNDGQSDMHTAPLTQKVDWESVMKGLAAARYRGDFTLEANNFLKTFPPDFIDVGLKFMYDASRCLVDKFAL